MDGLGNVKIGKDDCEFLEIGSRNNSMISLIESLIQSRKHNELKSLLNNRKDELKDFKFSFSKLEIINEIILLLRIYESTPNLNANIKAIIYTKLTEGINLLKSQGASIEVAHFTLEQQMMKSKHLYGIPLSFGWEFWLLIFTLLFTVLLSIHLL